jgi:glycosyltransferase involved in cell wall biosynthesis
MATVSIVMPGFNVAPYIGEAIESVIAQTVRDWELLVVDDGSTDSTAEIVRGFAAGERRIRVMTQQNSGISTARNLALSVATGEYIAILDSDDLWEPTYLERQLAVFKAQPDIDIVTGNGWFLGGRLHGRPARPCPDVRPQPSLTDIIQDETSIFIMSIMRRRVYDTIGGFDERLRTNEDYEFWLRAAIAGFRFVRNDEPLGHYRRRDDSLSSSDVRMVTGILRVYEQIKPMLVSRPAELRLVERQIARFERERLAATARAALSSNQPRAAADPLAELYARTGGTLWGIASLMARYMPRLLASVYQFRLARRKHIAGREARTSDRVEPLSTHR